MLRVTPRAIRNLAFVLLVGTVFVVMQTNIRAATESVQTWCSGQDGCDPGWCGEEEGYCWSEGELWQGCYEDADPDCGCAIQCSIPE